MFANSDIFTDEIEEQEDGVEGEMQGGDGAGCPCSHKECLSLEETSMVSNLWIAFIV
jgi:hypothetical protein